MIDLNLSNLTQLFLLIANHNNFEFLDVSDCLNLDWVEANNNQLESFDISQNPKVYFLELPDNNLTTINIKNNRNNSLQLIDTRRNINLSCIQVDNVNYPSTRHCYDNDFWCMGPPYNPDSYYSEDCSLISAEFSSVDFRIYPNPVKDVLRLNSQEPINSLKIYSITGKLLKEATESSINVSELSSGIYFVMVSIDGKTDTKKFIKI